MGVSLILKKNESSLKMKEGFLSLVHCFDLFFPFIFSKSFLFPKGLANQLGMMFMEVSGKTGHNVDDLFFELASTLVQRKNPYIKKARC